MGDVIGGVKGTEAREFMEEEELAGIEGCHCTSDLSSLVWCPPIGFVNLLYGFLVPEQAWLPFPVSFFWQAELQVMYSAIAETIV